MALDGDCIRRLLRVGTFLRDWAALAPLNLWILLAVSQTYGLTLVSEELGKGALLTFGIACIVAHYGSVGISEWTPTHSLSLVLRMAVYSAWWGSIALSLLTLGGVAIGTAMQSKAESADFAADGPVGIFVRSIVAPITEIAVEIGVLVTLIGILTGLYAAVLPPIQKESS